MLEGMPCFIDGILDRAGLVHFSDRALYPPLTVTQFRARDLTDRGFLVVKPKQRHRERETGARWLNYRVVTVERGSVSDSLKYSEVFVNRAKLECRKCSVHPRPVLGTDGQYKPL